MLDHRSERCRHARSVVHTAHHLAVRARREVWRTRQITRCSAIACVHLAQRLASVLRLIRQHHQRAHSCHASSAGARDEGEAAQLRTVIGTTLWRRDVPRVMRACRRERCKRRPAASLPSPSPPSQVSTLARIGCTRSWTRRGACPSNSSRRKEHAATARAARGRNSLVSKLVNDTGSRHCQRGYVSAGLLRPRCKTLREALRETLRLDATWRPL